MESEKKDNRGGARRKRDPIKGASTAEKVMLYGYQKTHVIKKYGSLSKGIQALILRDGATAEV